MNIEDQIATYGCTLAELQVAVTRVMEIERCGPVQVAMTYTTLAKNLVLTNDKNRAVQYLNCLKWVLSTYVMDDGE